jgi:MoaA/NifB/PqqE/SkfB family radical SAM enzyme
MNVTNLLHKKFKNEIQLFKYFFKNNLINNYRVKIDTGFACNANCFFCYYKTHLKDPFLDSKEIFNQIKVAKSLGFKKMEFSGGESSYHPDWFNFLDFVKENDLEASTLSNGFMFSDYNFIKKSKEKGLSEILFSLHSFKENHDKHLRVKGAFDKIIRAIKNSIKLNITIRINITITPLNQNYLKDLFEYLDKENILQNIHQGHSSYYRRCKCFFCYVGRYYYC